MTPSRPANYLTAIATWLVILSPVLVIAGRAPTDIGLSLVAILFLAHSALTRNGSWLRERWVQVALVLTAYMCARNLMLADPDKAFTHSLVWIRFPVFAAALAYWILPDETVRKKFIYSLTAMLVFLAADGAFQYITGTDIFGRETVYYQLASRLTGPFSSPRLGLTMAWLFLPAVLFWLSVTARDVRSKHFAASVLFYVSMLVIIFISAERMAFIFSAFSSALAFLLLRRLRPVLFGVGILSILIIAALAVYQPGLVGRQYGQTSHEVTNFTQGSYGKSFAEGWQLTMNHPFFGVGGKHYSKACDHEIKANDATAFCGLHPHNFYLDWFAEYGFIGAGLMIALIALWFARAFCHWRVILSDTVLTALFIMLIIRFWPLAAVTSQFTVWSAYPQWLVVGWFLAQLAAARKA